MTSSEIKLIKVSCPVCNRDSNRTVASGYDFEYATCAQEFFFRECKGCDLVYLSPRPAATELARIYPDKYNPFRFHNIKNPIARLGRNFVQRKKVHEITKLLPQRANIIDVGCGSGTLLMLLRKFGRKHWRLFGNDFNSEALNQVKRLRIETIPGRFEEIDTSLRFDLIILNQTLEHLDYPARVIRKAAESLAPNGVLFIETPSIEGLDAVLFRRRYWGGYHIPRHWTLFSANSINKLLLAEGFQKVKVTYLTSPSFWIQSFHHYFLDRGYPKWWVDFWMFKNPLLLTVFTFLDIITVTLGYPTSNIRIVAQKF